MWKYGAHGHCQFETLGKCQDAAAAIHAKPKENDSYSSEILEFTTEQEKYHKFMKELNNGKD